MFHAISGRKFQLHRAVVLCTMLLLLASFALPSLVSAAGGPVMRVKDDINAVLGEAPDHPCTGEAMTATGDVLLMLWAPDYRMHVNGAGVTMVGADSGNLYRFNGALNEFLSADGQVYHSVHHFTFFSPTQGDAFVATFLSHTTVHPDGTISVEFEFANGGCK